MAVNSDRGLGAELDNTRLLADSGIMGMMMYL